MTVHIGRVTLDNPILLAPMAGVTTAPVRRLARRLGVGATHSEMVSATALDRGSRKTEGLMALEPDQGPAFIQLFGPDPEELAQGAVIALQQGDALGISINMACPMPKVTKRGSGSALLNDLPRACRMVQACRSRLPDVPLWVKIRKHIGPKGEEDTVQIAGKLLECGADTITIHGRTAAQMYDGENDHRAVATLCRAFPGRILASGDLFTAEGCRRAFDDGAVGIMLARGFVKDPLLVPAALAAWQGEHFEPTAHDRIQLFEEFLQDMMEREDLHRTLITVKRFGAGLVKGLSGAGQLRQALGAARSFDDLEEIRACRRRSSERGKDDE